MVRKVSFNGGMYDYLGTKDMREVETRATTGDAKAKLIFDAFLYQVCKDIAMYGAMLCGKVDALFLQGALRIPPYFKQK